MEGRADREVSNSRTIVRRKKVGVVGSAASRHKSFAVGSMRFGQITLSTPLHCRRERSTELGEDVPGGRRAGHRAATIFRCYLRGLRKIALRNSSRGPVTAMSIVRFWWAIRRQKEERLVGPSQI